MEQSKFSMIEKLKQKLGATGEKLLAATGLFLATTTVSFAQEMPSPQENVASMRIIEIDTAEQFHGEKNTEVVYIKLIKGDQGNLNLGKGEQFRGQFLAAGKDSDKGFFVKNIAVTETKNGVYKKKSYTIFDLNKDGTPDEMIMEDEDIKQTPGTAYTIKKSDMFITRTTSGNTVINPDFIIKNNKGMEQKKLLENFYLLYAFPLKQIASTHDEQLLIKK